VMDGYLLYFFPNADLAFTYSFFPPLVSANVTLYAIFFLDIKTFVPRLYRFALLVHFYFVAYVVMLFFLPRPVVLLMNQVNAVLVLSYIFFLGIMAGRNRNKLGYYLAAAYFFYYCIVMVEVVYIHTGAPHYLYGISHVSIAILIEAVILAFLLSMRSRWEKEEIEYAKEEAQKLLLKKIQENETIVRDQNIVLEETVKQRTKEIARQKEIVEQTLEEKEELLNEKEVLLKEIHHRVKNNLQTISSILILQSAGLQDEEAKKAIAESQHRVRSIALVHQQLYQTDGVEKINLNTFIKDLSAQIKSVFHLPANQVSIEWNIPETNVSMDAAIPLGLIFNELLTNSFKYAFNGENKGEIKIELAYLSSDVPHSPSRKVQLRYWDNGKGFASDFKLEDSSTLGLKLIKLLSQQIGSTLQLRGSEFVFNFILND
jgi:two-component sensor histidine kinase